jgi:HD-like signal output (HDOD) protein
MTNRAPATAAEARNERGKESAGGKSDWTELLESASLAGAGGASVAVSPSVRAADLVARARSLASFPRAFHQVSEVIARRDSSADLIAEAMKSDQSLCARMLKLANSAYCGLPSRVDNLRQAVVIIGVRQIQDLMAATLAVNQFKGVSPDLVDMKSFWRHSLACGLAAKFLAQVRHEPNTERFFITGLLHDIGSLVLYQEEPALASQALLAHIANNVALEVAEREVFGFDHAETTRALLAVWRLPPGIADAAATHHRPSESDNEIVATTIHIADALAYSFGFGTAGEVHAPSIALSAWETLGLTPEISEEVQREVQSRLDEVEGLFLTDD